MKSRLLALLLLALPAAAFPQYKPWYNYFNFAYGAKAQAMGKSFVAVADDLSAAFWNPAGLASKRGPEFFLSYKTSSQKHDYDLQDRVISGETRLYTYDWISRLNQIDYFSLSAPFSALGRPCAFALSYYRYIPYGFKGSASEVVTFLHDRYHPQKTTVTFAGSEGLDVLGFSAAAAVTHFLSLGATLQQFFNSGSMHFKTVDVRKEFHSQFTEKLQGRNLILGVLVSPARFLRLGFAWHGGLKSKFDSQLLAWDVSQKGETFNQRQAGCQARVIVPEQRALGVLLQPARWLSLSAEYSLLDWDGGWIENYYDAPAPLPYPQLDDWKLKQQKIRNLRFGMEARLPFRSWQLNLRGGFSRDRQLYADSLGEAVRIQGYSAGIGCEFSRYTLLEVTYERQRSDWLENGYFGLRPDVNTHYRANVFFLALTYRFGHIFKE